MKNLSLLCILFLVLSCQHSQHEVTAQNTIDHVVVIYMENHSFHNLFAEFPRADETLPSGYHGQLNEAGLPYKTLPPVTVGPQHPPDKRFPADLPNQPFRINQYAKISEKVPDPVHEFYLHQAQIDNGKMDRFAEFARVGALTMGYYDLKGTYLWKYAQEYTLADHFFQSAFGGSFLNHQWMVAARTPLYANAPQDVRTVLNPDGTPKKFGSVTPDGFAVNTIQPLNAPFDPAAKLAEKRLPPLEYKNIGDLLSEKNIAWAWYSGGWAQTVAGNPVEEFQYHHQPLAYFKNYGPNTPGRQEHLKDETDLFADIKAEHLPAVAFFKPTGEENAHPGYSDVASGDAKMHKLIQTIQDSPYWDSTLIIVTFDEHGGFWDPIAPPRIDRWGPGSRIPAIFISPWVKKNYVDHTQYETVSILAYIEKRFGLPALGDRDAKANPLTGVFQ